MITIGIVDDRGTRHTIVFFFNQIVIQDVTFRATIDVWWSSGVFFTCVNRPVLLPQPYGEVDERVCKAALSALVTETGTFCNAPWSHARLEFLKFAGHFELLAINWTDSDGNGRQKKCSLRSHPQGLSECAFFKFQRGFSFDLHRLDKGQLSVAAREEG